MRPAIDRDREYVARGVKSAWPEHPRQVRADGGLVVFESPREQQSARRAQGRPRVVDARDHGHVHQVQHDRLARVPATSIASHADRVVELDPRMKARDSVDLVHPQALPCPPVAYQHVRVDERHLDVLPECGRLRGR